MSNAVPIVLTLLASTVARVGIVFLKRTVAARVAGQEHGLRSMLAHIVRSKAALAGAVLQVVAIALFAAALDSPQAPISVLQPLRAFGIVIMAVLAVVFLHERLGAGEWLGVALITVGVVLLSVSIVAATPAPERIERMQLLTLLTGIALVGLSMIGLLWWAPRGYEEVLFGVLTGIFLGIGYLHIKVFFLARHQHLHDLIAPSAAASTVGFLLGFAVLLWSLRRARALIVTTVNLVVNQVVVIFGGWYCLGEAFPYDPLPRYARIFGLATSLLGIGMLAHLNAPGRESPCECCRIPPRT